MTEDEFKNDGALLVLAAIEETLGIEIEDYKKGICEPDGAEAGGCCMSREYQVFSMSQGGALDFVLFIPLLFLYFDIWQHNNETLKNTILFIQF